MCNFFISLPDHRQSVTPCAQVKTFLQKLHFLLLVDLLTMCRGAGVKLAMNEKHWQASVFTPVQM